MQLRFWRKKAPSAPVVPSGPYVGRLAFDSDSAFHIDPNGWPVVTDDEGKTWRYATPDDTSHNARYHTGVLHAVSPTTQEAFEAGDPAHAHHDVWEPGVSHPDVTAPVQTSHTAAYEEQA